MDSPYEFHLIGGAIFGSIAIFNGILLFRTYKKLRSGASGAKTKIELALESLTQIGAFGFLMAIAYLAWFQKTNDVEYERIMRGGKPDTVQPESPWANPMIPEP